MNNRFKFRVWNTIEKKFINDPYGDYNISFEGQVIILGDSGGCSVEHDVIIQQYTGLNDKNGKEIYEGDIVINTTPDEEYCSPAVVVWAKYEDLTYALAYNYKGVIEPHMEQLVHILHHINSLNLIEEFRLSKFGTYEVIGNVFENIDLLK